MFQNNSQFSILHNPKVESIGERYEKEQAKRLISAKPSSNFYQRKNGTINFNQDMIALRALLVIKSFYLN